jgi:flagellar protein FliS
MIPVRYALNEYKQTNVDAGTAYADPHTLIAMLFDGLQERLSVAKGAMERKDFAAKGQAIGKAMDIISYLQACLDKESGGEIAANLDMLYEYITGCLLRANARNAPTLLEEVGGLVREIQEAWAVIRTHANKAVAAHSSPVAP